MTSTKKNRLYFPPPIPKSELVFLGRPTSDKQKCCKKLCKKPIEKLYEWVARLGSCTFGDCFKWTKSCLLFCLAVSIATQIALQVAVVQPTVVFVTEPHHTPNPTMPPTSVNATASPTLL
jgi:hypothetical protein